MVQHRMLFAAVALLAMACSPAFGAISAPQDSLDTLISGSAGFGGSTLLRDLVDLSGDNDLNDLYYGAFDGVVLLPNGDGPNAKKFVDLLGNLPDDQAATVAKLVAWYHVLPSGVVPSNLWQAANYSNYLKPGVFATGMDFGATYSNNLSVVPSFFSLAQVPPFILQEWKFGSKPQVYGAWGGAGYDPTRVGVVQPQGATTRGTVYYLDDMLVPPTTGELIPLLDYPWGGLNGTINSITTDPTLVPTPVFSGAATARKVSTLSKGVTGSTTYTTFTQVFDRLAPLSARRAFLKYLEDPNSVYTLFLPTVNAINTYMQAKGIKNPANIPASILARHIVVNQTLFTEDLFGGPPASAGNVSSSTVFLTTFGNGTLVLNRTIESIPAVPGAKTPVLYEVCTKAGSTKQNMVNTQLVGANIIAGKSVIHFINYVLGSGSC